MLELMIRNSKIAVVVKSALSRYVLLTNSLSGSYINSRSYRVICNFHGIYERCAASSRFMGFVRSKGPVFDIYDSRVVRISAMLTGSIRKGYDKLSGTSKLSLLTDDLKKGFHADPLRVVGIVASTAILTRVSMTLLLSAQIGRLEFMFMAIFIVLGAVVVFAGPEWRQVEKDSYFFRLFKNRK